jgi:hypothetical protein
MEQMDEQQYHSAVVAQALDSGTSIEEAREIEARNVFGFDVKKDRNGNYLEQGVSAFGHESANHYAVLLKAEQQSLEPKGAWAAAIADTWKRDPKRAETLRLPKPPSMRNSWVPEIPITFPLPRHIRRKSQSLQTADVVYANSLAAAPRCRPLTRRCKRRD